MKKVLILTTSTGGGHNEAASSLEKEFNKHGFVVKRLDALMEINKSLDAFIIGAFKILVGAFPKLYGNLYNKSKNERFNKLMTNCVSKISKDKIYEIILNEKPDLIISTHPFFGESNRFFEGK